MHTQSAISTNERQTSNTRPAVLGTTGRLLSAYVATAICDALEQNNKATELTTHASITARPFFEKRGYTVVREQQVERRGELLTNFVMRKERGK